MYVNACRLSKTCSWVRAFSVGFVKELSPVNGVVPIALSLAEGVLPWYKPSGDTLGVKSSKSPGVVNPDTVVYFELVSVSIFALVPRKGVSLRLSRVVKLLVVGKAPGKSANRLADTEAHNKSLGFLRPLILYNPSVNPRVTPAVIVPDVVLSRLMPVR